MAGNGMANEITGWRGRGKASILIVSACACNKLRNFSVVWVSC